MLSREILDARFPDAVGGLVAGSTARGDESPTLPSSPAVTGAEPDDGSPVDSARSTPTSARTWLPACKPHFEGAVEPHEHPRSQPTDRTSPPSPDAERSLQQRRELLLQRCFVRTPLPPDEHDWFPHDTRMSVSTTTWPLPEGAITHPR